MPKTQTPQSSQSSASQPAFRWPAAWPPEWATPLAGAERWLQDLQQVASEMQGEFNRISWEQLDDLLETCSEITTKLGAATQDPRAMATTPMVISGRLMSSAEAGNRRWMEFVQRINSRCLESLNPAMPTPAKAEPATGGESAPPESAASRPAGAAAEPAAAGKSSG